MWCVDLRKGLLINKQGVTVSMQWTKEGKLNSELLVCQECSELRKRQLLHEARHVALKSVA